VKLFWRENCPKCPAAKAAIADMPDVEYHNVDEVNGLAEAAFYGVLSTPSIVLTENDGTQIKSWLGEVPVTSEISECLYQQQV